jgi:hypothetical protein
MMTAGIGVMIYVIAFVAGMMVGALVWLWLTE